MVDTIRVEALMDVNLGNKGKGLLYKAKGDIFEIENTPETMDLINQKVIVRVEKGPMPIMASPFDNLRKVKGIGEETISDIEKAYNTVEELKAALKADKCPLRNDVCEKLKKALNLINSEGD